MIINGVSHPADEAARLLELSVAGSVPVRVDVLLGRPVSRATGRDDVLLGTPRYDVAGIAELNAVRLDAVIRGGDTVNGRVGQDAPLRFPRDETKPRKPAARLRFVNGAVMHIGTVLVTEYGTVRVSVVNGTLTSTTRSRTNLRRATDSGSGRG